MPSAMASNGLLNGLFLASALVTLLLYGQEWADTAETGPAKCVPTTCATSTDGAHCAETILRAWTLTCSPRIRRICTLNEY